MNVTLLILQALGYQGGTIHQASQETGLTTAQIIDLSEITGNQKAINSDYSKGWFSIRTGSGEFFKNNLAPQYKGNQEFWAGVVRGLYLTQQSQKV